jgi:hypothetical protein
MLVADMINSCSNEKVAQAAVACIGGQFAERVRAVALENGLSVGRLISFVVRDYAMRADEEARALLYARMAGADQPILDGLRHVVEHALGEGRILFHGDRFDPQLPRGDDSFRSRLGRFQGMLLTAF